MSIANSKLSFSVIPTFNCKELVIADTSHYVGTVEGNTLLIKMPDRDEVKEMVYTKNTLTIVNSNSLGLSNVDNLDDLSDLPDGWYTIKITICPYDTYWYEKDYYRICKLQCKYYQAVLKLGLSECQSCYNPKILEKLQLAKVYMEGIVGNTLNDDINSATNLYQSADKLLDSILNNKNCKDCGGYKHNWSQQ